MLSQYQLKIAYLYNIPIGNVKKQQCPILFNEGKYVVHYENLQLYLRLALKQKNLHCILELSQSQWLKVYIEFKIQ